MERTLLTVEPYDAGWRVSISGKSLQLHDHQLAAIEAANELAQTRHHATGEPTGVRVQVGRHGQVLVGLHG